MRSVPDLKDKDDMTTSVRELHTGNRTGAWMEGGERELVMQ